MEIIPWWWYTTVHFARRLFRCMRKVRNINLNEKVRNINLNAFRNDITISSLDTEADVEVISTEFDNVLSNLLDRHAPLISKSVSLRPHAPWYDDAIRNQKRERRRYERQYCKSGLEVHRQMYRDQCNIYAEMVDKAKSNYHRQQIKDCDQKLLFRQVDKICSGGSEKVLPSYEDAEELANDFANFIEDKIRKVRNKLDNIPTSSTSPSHDLHDCSSSFSKFNRLSEEDIEGIIMKSPNSSCSLDSIPTWLLKECLPELLPFITHIVNRSLLSGVFPVIIQSVKCNSTY